MRPYGKPKQKPQTDKLCVPENGCFTKRKAPNYSPMCLTDVYPLKNCVLCIYHGSSAVLIAKNSAAFSKAGILLLLSQFPGENTEGHN